MLILTLPAPRATFYFHWRSGRLRRVDWQPPAEAVTPDWPYELREWMMMLQDYFVKPRLLPLPLELHGTDFQLRVWQALRTIPPGEVATYGELAARLHTSPRAVGNACRWNPCPLVVPCHRVVRRDGIGGYAGHSDGETLDIKRWLLRHENVRV